MMVAVGIVAAGGIAAVAKGFGIVYDIICDEFED